MNKTVKKIWNTVTTVLVGCAVVLVMLLVGVELFGIDTYIVLSGSMEPEIPTGSLIYVTEADELNENDVITFRLSEGTVVTHRIIEIVEDHGELLYKTKGDANDVSDGGMVSEAQILGTPIFTIPMLGYLASYLQSKSGFYMVIAIGAVIVLLLLIPEFFEDENKGSNESKDS